MPTDMTELRARLAEIADLGRAAAVLAWDERTMMPPGGSEARAEQLATLAAVRHRLFASDEMGALIAFLASEPAAYITGALVPIDGGLLHSLG